MNLKESFRYQKFLDHMMHCACASIMEREHSVWVTKTHKRSEVNPEAEDFSEDVVCAEEFFLNDGVVQFMDHLVEEKEKLSNAIGRAKAAAGLDIDAAVEVNRCRQLAASSIEQMLAFTPKQRTEQGTGYKFNVEGNQTKYVYEIDIEEEDAFDRAEAKRVRRTMISASDRLSEQIDRAMINTVVEYAPPYDVNDTFEDVMDQFGATLDLDYDQEATDERPAQKADQGQAVAPVQKSVQGPQYQAAAKEAPAAEKAPVMGPKPVQPVERVQTTQAPAQTAERVPERRSDAAQAPVRPAGTAQGTQTAQAAPVGQNTQTRTAPVQAAPAAPARPQPAQHSQNSAPAQPMQRTQPVAGNQTAQTAPMGQGERRTAAQGQGAETARREAPAQTVRPNQNGNPTAPVQPAQRTQQQTAGAQTVQATQAGAPVRPVTNAAQTQAPAAPPVQNGGGAQTAAPGQQTREAYIPPVPPVQDAAAEQVQNEMEYFAPDVDRDTLDDILVDVDNPEFDNPGYYGGQG